MKTVWSGVSCHWIYAELIVDHTVKQRGVVNGIIVGVTVTLVVVLGAILRRPMALSPDATSGDRIAFALSADAFIALWLGISIALLARHRFLQSRGYRRRRTDSRLGESEHTASHAAKYAGTVGSGGAGAFIVGHSDARVTGSPRYQLRSLSSCVVACFFARISRRCADSSAWVCAHLIARRY